MKNGDEAILISIRRVENKSLRIGKRARLALNHQRHLVSLNEIHRM